MKKIKLILSICLMCLSVAVLCMGILAANSATYNINGNISYNMIDGVARVNARVYKVAGTGTLTSDQLTENYITSLATMELENISKSTSPNYILTQTEDTIAISSDGETVSFSADIVYGANTDQSTYYTYFIVLNITNQSTETGYVLNTYLSELGTSTVSNIATNANGETNKITITSNDFTNIVIGLSYNGGTISDSDKIFNCTLTVTYDELEWFDLNLTGTLTYYASGDYKTWNVDITIKFKYGITWSEIVSVNSDLLSVTNVTYYIYAKDYFYTTQVSTWNYRDTAVGFTQDSSFVLSSTVTIASAEYGLKVFERSHQDEGLSGGGVVV